jgi:hypothetical protein
MNERTVQVKEDEVRITKGTLTRASSTTAASRPESKAVAPVFTQTDFENALDKVSRRRIHEKA